MWEKGLVHGRPRPQWYRFAIKAQVQHVVRLNACGSTSRGSCGMYMYARSRIRHRSNAHRASRITRTLFFCWLTRTPAFNYSTMLFTALWNRYREQRSDIGPLPCIDLNRVMTKFHSFHLLRDDIRLQNLEFFFLAFSHDAHWDRAISLFLFWLMTRTTFRRHSSCPTG